MDMQRFVRDSGLNALILCKLLDVCQIATGQKCTVLIYHSVASGDSNPYLDPDTFTAHMDMLRAEFHVLSADEYLAHLDRGKPIPRRSVLITIDDGLENNYTVIQPIMEQRQLPWVLFTPTQALEQDDRLLWFAMLRGICLYSRKQQLALLGRTWSLNGNGGRARIFSEMVGWAAKFCAEESREAVLALSADTVADVPESYINNFCRLMTADQLCQLAKSPLVEIGCHTKFHPFLPHVSARELSVEIDGATRCLCDLLNRKIRTFAYPSGYYGWRELERVAALGYDCAFAVVPRLNAMSRFEIPRVGVYGPSPSVLRAKALGLSAVLKSFGVATG
jgi:peptidoglycan/xylan/chitin deacetylase (PgdA/CDA1 family)